MADNDTTLDAGGATVTYASDEVSSVKYPRVKHSVGADGSARDFIGQCTLASYIGAATENATVVKASAGYLHWVDVSTLNASVRYLKFYNKATTPSEADTPVMRVTIPASGAAKVINFGDHPAYFSAGIAFRVVTGIADADDTAPTATQELINVGYN